MNFIADSGAIFKTLMPLPRHSDLTPPSRIICPKPPVIRMLLLLEAWTWGGHEEGQQQSTGIHSMISNSLLPEQLASKEPPHPQPDDCVSPAWVLWACPAVPCMFETRHPHLLQPLGVATTCLFSSLLPWTHRAPSNSPQRRRSKEEAQV